MKLFIYFFVLCSILMWQQKGYFLLLNFCQESIYMIQLNLFSIVKLQKYETAVSESKLDTFDLVCF